MLLEKHSEIYVFDFHRGSIKIPATHRLGIRSPATVATPQQQKNVGKSRVFGAVASVASENPILFILFSFIYYLLFTSNNSNKRKNIRPSNLEKCVKSIVFKIWTTLFVRVAPATHQQQIKKTHWNYTLEHRRPLLWEPICGQGQRRSAL